MNTHTELTSLVNSMQEATEQVQVAINEQKSTENKVKDYLIMQGMTDLLTINKTQLLRAVRRG